MSGAPHEGTPRALIPVTERVLAWVANQRRLGLQTDDDLRAIELCALATREACFFHDMYGTRTGHIVHRDPEDDSGYYLPDADRDIIRDNYVAPNVVSYDGQVCARCGAQASKWMMGTADESPTYLCGLWPHCEEHHAPAPQVFEQRRAPGGLPSPEGGCGCSCP